MFRYCLITDLGFLKENALLDSNLYDKFVQALSLIYSKIANISSLIDKLS